MSRESSRRRNVVTLPFRSHARVVCEVALGRIVTVEASGLPLVTVDGDPVTEPDRAAATVPVTERNVGSSVTLLLPSDGSPPIVNGVVRAAAPVADGVQVVLDGERLLLEADREIVLQCGKSSITLTREGKVVIRGADLLEASTGRHRIKGGTVEIN
jgi:hypothetical protein